MEDCLSLKFHSRPQVHPVSSILLNRSYQLMNLQKYQLHLSEFESLILIKTLGDVVTGNYFTYKNALGNQSKFNKLPKI